MIYPDERDLLEYFDMDSDEREWPSEKEFVGSHGKIVKVQQVAFCDIMIYEDGHEERFYIGDWKENKHVWWYQGSTGNFEEYSEV